MNKFSSTLIQKIRESKEISYYELKNYFEHKLFEFNESDEVKFNLEEELDNLENMGIVKEEEGMIIFEGL